MKKATLFLAGFLIFLHPIFSQEGKIFSDDCRIEYSFTFFHGSKEVFDLNNLDCSQNLKIIFKITKAEFKEKDIEVRFPVEGGYQIPEGLKWGIKGKPVVVSNRNVGSLTILCDQNVLKNEISGNIVIPIWIGTKKGTSMVHEHKAKSRPFRVKLFEDNDIGDPSETASRSGNGSALGNGSGGGALGNGSGGGAVGNGSGGEVENGKGSGGSGKGSGGSGKGSGGSGKGKSLFITQIAKEWKRTPHGSNNCKEVIQFLIKHPNDKGSEIEEAKKIILEQCQLVLNYEKILFEKNVIKLKISNLYMANPSFKPVDLVYVRDKRITEAYAEYTLEIKSNNLISLSVISFPDGREKNIIIDPRQPALSAKFLVENGLLKIIDLKGGNGNYSIELIDLSDVQFEPKQERIGNAVTIKESDIRSGSYKVILVDSRRSEIFTLGNYKKKGNTGFILLSVILLLGLLILLIYIWYNKRQQELHPSDEYVKRIKNQIKISQKDKSEVTTKEEEINISSLISINPKQIKIKTKSPIKLDENQLLSLEQRWEQVQLIPEAVLKDKASYFPCTLLNQQWEDSAVVDAFIHERFAIRLNNFVFDVSENRRSQDILEIGGFILGSVEKIADKNQYQVILERFVNIAPESNNQYQIEFGPAAWNELVKHMDDVYKDQEYLLLGWFHTHPGHGLFLSQPDQNIHGTYFREKYHIALELDSIASERNPHYEFGIFSWKNNQTMNNSKDHLGHWFNWQEVKAWLKNTREGF